MNFAAAIRAGMSPRLTLALHPAFYAQSDTWNVFLAPQSFNPPRCGFARALLRQEAKALVVMLPVSTGVNFVQA